MFKKSKKNKDDKMPEAAGSAEIKSVSPLPSPVPRDLKTIIGEHMFIEGSIRGEETVEIEGSVEGEIELEKRNLTIGSKGRVKGEIHARNVSISGELKGNVKALEKVEVKREADFYGEIKAKCISVEDGACFKGVIELNREPQIKSSDTEEPKEPAAP
jgi:cytoskeletal protein CcmA (bactofilin family)